LLKGEEPEFEFVRPTNLLKTAEEWAEIKEYAEYVNDFFEVSRKTVENQITIDLEQLMVHDPNQSVF
jgi:hypothetical protein